MAGGISVHVVDVTCGLPAIGMKVEIFRMATPEHSIASGMLSGNGSLDHPIIGGKECDRGVYEVLFYIGDFYRHLGSPLSDTPFLDVAPFRFGISDAEQHYHLPLKVSPRGFSLFWGG